MAFFLLSGIDLAKKEGASISVGGRKEARRTRPFPRFVAVLARYSDENLTLYAIVYPLFSVVSPLILLLWVKYEP